MAKFGKCFTHKPNEKKQYTTHRAAIEDQGLNLVGHYRTTTGIRREIYRDMDGTLYAYYGADHCEGNYYAIQVKEFIGSLDEIHPAI